MVGAAAEETEEHQKKVETEEDVEEETGNAVEEECTAVGCGYIKV